MIVYVENFLIKQKIYTKRIVVFWFGKTLPGVFAMQGRRNFYNSSATGPALSPGLI